MKKYLTLVVIAAALTTASFSAMAVQSLTQSTDTSQLQPAGTVSVSRASNLDNLQNKLAEKPPGRCKRLRGEFRWRR